MKNIKFNMLEKNKIKLSIFIIIIFTIRFSYLIYNFNFKYVNLDENKKIQVTIIRNESISEDKITYLVKYDLNNFLLNIYIDEYNNKDKKSNTNFDLFCYGDKIEFRGKIIIPKKLNNPYEFDYKKYLNSNNIVGTISTYNVKKINNSIGNPIFKFAYFLRDDISKKIDNYIPKKEAGLFKSIIYGDDRTLDEKIKEDFNKNGIMHLIAVSGSHMAIILIVISLFDKFFSKEISLFISFFVILIFSIMCGMQNSTIRAAIMAIIFLICKYFNIRINIYIKILFSFLIIFIYNPYTVFDIGFLMSYLATIGIVMFYSQVYSFIDIIIIKFLKIGYTRRNKFKICIYNCLKYINKLLSISISVQIMIMPIQISYFNSFEITSIISNIIIVSITTFETFIGFITIILIYIPIVSDIIINSNYILLKCIIFLTSFLSNLNIPNINFPTINFSAIIIYYIYVVMNNFNKYIIFKIKNIYVKNYKLFFSIFKVFMFLYIVFLIIYFLKIENYIFFFNVEQGNMAFIHKNGKNIIVDIGSTKEKLASNILSRFLKAKCIKSIDLVILTHMHTDHTNGLEEIMSKVNIKNIIYSLPKSDNVNEYKNFLKLVDEKKISTIIVNEYDRIEFKNICIDVLSPPIERKVESLDELNANSAVYLVSINKINYLFMGDATKESEYSLIKNLNSMKDNKKKDEILIKLKNIKVAQIGHHGSKTSTSEYFLNNICIKNAIISSKKEIYGHPAQETIDILKRYSIKTFITQKVGAIRF